MNSDFINGIGSIASDLPQWVAIVLAVLVFMALCFCIYRAQSIDFLLDRTWIFFGGNKEFNDHQLNDEWNIIRDLELYRYRYGFPFNSISEIDFLREKIKDNNISIIDLRKICSVFNFDKFEVKSKTFYFEKILLLLMACFVISFSFAGIQLGLKDSSYFVVVDTDEKFLFDGKIIVFQDKTLKRNDCRKVVDMPYPDYEKDKNLFNHYMACEMFAADGKKFYEKTINEQRAIGVVAIILFVFIFSFIIRSYTKYNLAIKINNIIEDNKKKKEN